jgi:large subunit ribosomal protein L4e
VKRVAEEKKKQDAPAPAEASKKDEPKAPKEAPAKAQTPKKEADKAPKKKSKKEGGAFAAYSDLESERSSIQVPVLSLDSKELRTIHLPKVFETPVRTDLIARAVQAARANRRQPYGAPVEGVWAGRRHSTEWSGKGHGISRVQRLKQGNGAATSPNNVGGARAHPPRVANDRSEKINIKERRRARRSALAAVAREDLVRARGHRFEDGLRVPVIVEAKFESLFRDAKDKNEDEEGRTQATKELVTALSNLGLSADLARARDGTHQRAGRGKMRGRRFRVPRSVLIVASNDKELSRCARNVPGVEVVSPKRLSTEALAPGGSPGRLTLITETALFELKALR